jgi:hypothetical protein
LAFHVAPIHPKLGADEIGESSSCEGDSVGLFWRLFAPKPLKKARRTVRKATHPVSLITPKPVKKVRRAASTVAHPWEAIEFAAENQVVRAVRGGGSRKARSTTSRADGLPHRFTDAWIRANMPRLTSQQAAYVLEDMRRRGWSENELQRRVYPYVRGG